MCCPAFTAGFFENFYYTVCTPLTYWLYADWLYAEQVSSDMVKVLVSHVSLVDGPLLYDDTVKMLFVDYSFLDLPIKETETPCSVVKPTMPDKNIMFNFLKCKSI